MIYTPLTTIFFTISFIALSFLIRSIYPYQNTLCVLFRRICAMILALRPRIPASEHAWNDTEAQDPTESPGSLVSFHEIHSKSQLSISVKESVRPRASCVQWLFFWFFFYLWIWSGLRALYYMMFWWYLASSRIHGSKQLLTQRELDCLGHYALYRSSASKMWFLVTFHVLSITALSAADMILFPLTYELSRLVRNRMDRGPVKETRQVFFYFCCVQSFLFVFLLIQITLILVYHRYEMHAEDCITAVYLLQLAGLAYMLVTLLYLRNHRRNYEVVQGAFALSPLYSRLKVILLIYSIFSCVFQMSYLFTRYVGVVVLEYVGITLVCFSITGLAMAVCMGCSQSYVLSLLHRYFPSDVPQDNVVHPFGSIQLLSAKEKDSGVLPDTRDSINRFTADVTWPVFVCTDIESSSRLWAIENGEIMQEATRIHDAIMRNLLPRFCGYEIATRGDAFQLAFQSIKNAVEYCLTVQLELLHAVWPQALHNLIPSTRRERVGRRQLLFSGLRVRMGIHDAHSSEGVLVRDVHPVTGKTMYTGVSESIVNEVTDLACGGQILIAQRIASWLCVHHAVICPSFHLIWSRRHRIIHTDDVVFSEGLELYSVLPNSLQKRQKHFG
uniref:Uncharacterized protein AlNc14C174G8096 n=1 Tax=Albugo laibachii Nc14 TaxID=890382 RepID=F0WNT7_9STRA|nr:conserved hypothetical protein [Albugo laibachii Nc14]|eukprot:CCA22979.1 conserved hypothetical protein [Albugo laibachii Nc14]